MAYVVLARKYRPQRFDDMIGQEHVGRTLGNAIRQDRVHHAYLFAGARGLGKTTTARIFAKGLVCEEGPTPSPCNVCSECVAVNEGRSVDVIEIDGASNNSVENIRNLREQVHYLPQSARRKVYIIDEVHMLTTSAFNALLKTLEEPPPHVNFIFATTEPQKVLPTILSRVSRLDFRRVSPEEAVAHCKDILQREGLSIDDGGLRLVARASGGSVRDALTLLDQVIAFADDPKSITEEEARAVLGQAQRGAIAELVDAVLDRDPDAVLARFDALVDAGLDLMVLSLQLLEHFRDLAVVKVCKGSNVLRGATASEYEAVRAQAAKAEASVLGQLFDRFGRVVDRLPQSRVPRLLLEMGLLDLVHAEPLMPLGDLVERLHALADGGEAPSGASGSAAGSAGTRGAGRAVRSGGSAQRAEGVAGGARVEARAVEDSRGSSVVEAARAVEDSRASSAVEAARAVEDSRASSAGEAARAVEASRSSAALIGDGDSELTRALWAKLSGDLGEAIRSAPEATPSNGAARAGHGARPSNGAVGRAAAAGGEAAVGREPSAVGREPSAVGRDGSADAGKSVRSNGENGSDSGLLQCGVCSPAESIIEQDDREAFAVWEELVRRIRAIDEYASAVLSDLGLVELAGGVLRVAAPARSFAHTELASRPEIRATLEQACRDHLGAPHEVQLVEGEPELPARPSITLVEAQRRAAHQAAVEAEAAEHASIRALLRTFNAKITSTKPLH